MMKMKICAILFVASLLTVGFTSEVNAQAISNNRKLLNNSVDRNSPGGPSPCFHCMDGKGRQIIPVHDAESSPGVQATRDQDGSRN